MVLKLPHGDTCAFCMFENDVKMYGTQTAAICVPILVLFENDVKMYGPQTHFPLPIS